MGVLCRHRRLMMSSVSKPEGYVVRRNLYLVWEWRGRGFLGKRVLKIAAQEPSWHAAVPAPSCSWVTGDPTLMRLSMRSIPYIQAIHCAAFVRLFAARVLGET